MLPGSIARDELVEVMGHEAAIWSSGDRTFVLDRARAAREVERMASLFKPSLQVKSGQVQSMSDAEMRWAVARPSPRSALCAADTARRSAVDVRVEAAAGAPAQVRARPTRSRRT